MITVAEKVPVTTEISIRSDLETKLPKPYLAQAIVALDTENVNGNQGHKSMLLSLTKILMASSSHLRHSEARTPSPFFPIYVQNIHKAVHRIDSGTYDMEGRFIPANLRKIFSKYAHNAPDKLTFGKLRNMTQANCNAFEFFWIASKLQWGVLHLLARDRDGFFLKEAVR